MAITFPSSPTVGQTFTSGNKTWQWDGTTWLAYGASLSPTVLKVDSTNTRVGINNQSPATALDVIGTTQVRAAATQDGVVLTGRAGGTSSYDVTITPTTLTADRTLTLPDSTGTVGVIDTLWTAFTPTWTGITAGTGAANTGQYSVFNKMLFFRCKYILGTGGSLTATPVLTLPASLTMAISPQFNWIPSIHGAAVDSGVNSWSLAVNWASSSTLGFYVQTASGTYLTQATAVAATVPFTWGVNDYIEVSGFVQIV